MPSNFPVSADALTNPSPSDTLNNPTHSTQHINANDAIEAIEDYILNDRVGARVFATGGNVTISSTTFVDVTGLSIQFNITRTARISVGLGGTASHGTAGVGNYVDFDLDGVRVSGGATDGLMRWMVPVNDYWVNVSFTSFTAVLAPGIHTIKAQARVVSGTATYQATANQPMVMWIAEA